MGNPDCESLLTLKVVLLQSWPAGMLEEIRRNVAESLEGERIGQFIKEE
jgi:hypothetical protein